MFDKKEYDRQWKLKNKDKVNAYRRKWAAANKDKIREYNKQWQEDNKEKFEAIKKAWRENNKDKIKVLNDKSHQKFLETHNWSKYCADRKRARVEKLRQQGVKNPWSVIKGAEPKY